jgi:hypothetical protein
MTTSALDRLVVPEMLWEKLCRRAAEAPVASDLRQFPRRFLTAKVETEFVAGYPACRRDPHKHLTLVTDLSRRGLSFLHSEQVFPGERVRLALADTRRMMVEAVRCRKLGPRCYEVGGRFVAE